MLPNPDNSCAYDTVDAPSREVAEAAAVDAFSLTEEQRKRLVVQERG